LRKKRHCKKTFSFVPKECYACAQSRFGGVKSTKVITPTDSFTPSEGAGPLGLGMDPIGNPKTKIETQDQVDRGPRTQGSTSINRRDWLRLTVGVGAGLAVGELLDLSTVRAATQNLKLANVSEFTTSCNFCSCGCGMIAAVREGKLISMEGDYDHIVNRGSLCVKGISMFATHASPNRLMTPKYRAPVSRMRVANITWASNGELAIEKVRVFPSESVSGGSNSVTSADCPGLKSNRDGFSKWKAMVPSATSTRLNNLDPQPAIGISLVAKATSSIFGRFRLFPLRQSFFLRRAECHCILAAESSVFVTCF